MRAQACVRDRAAEAPREGSLGPRSGRCGWRPSPAATCPWRARIATGRGEAAFRSPMCANPSRDWWTAWLAAAPRAVDDDGLRRPRPRGAPSANQQTMRSARVCLTGSEITYAAARDGGFDGRKRRPRTPGARLASGQGAREAMAGRPDACAAGPAGRAPPAGPCAAISVSATIQVPRTRNRKAPERTPRLLGAAPLDRSGPAGHDSRLMERTQIASRSRRMDGPPGRLASMAASLAEADGSGSAAS